MTPKYQVGGLSSGIDTMSIIDQFVSIQKIPIQKVQQRQALARNQISVIGDLANRVNALANAAKELSTNGVRATNITSSTSTFSATSDSAALPGSYDITVQSMAKAAKAMSGSFSSQWSAVSGADLNFSISGKTYDISIADGTSLGDVVKQINASGAPVNASIINSGAGSYLSIVNRETGYSGNDASEGLQITSTPTGSGGTDLNLNVYEQASNAVISIDGQITVERQTNTMSDVLPGVSLTLKNTGGPETLSLAADTAATTARMQSFVNAVKNVNDRIDAITANTPENEAVLAGDSTLRGLKEQIKRVVTKTISNAGTLSNLGDIGLSHDRYGALRLDTAKFQKALNADPNGVNALFSDATTGVYSALQTIADNATKPNTGILTIRSSSLNNKVKAYDKQIERMNKSAESYRTQLTQQFSAMETIMSKLKATGNYLTQQQNQLAAAGKN